jgi:hypothetical protein
MPGRNELARGRARQHWRFCIGFVIHLRQC